MEKLKKSSKPPTRDNIGNIVGKYWVLHNSDNFHLLRILANYILDHIILYNNQLSIIESFTFSTNYIFIFYHI